MGTRSLAERERGTTFWLLVIGIPVAVLLLLPFLIGASLGDRVHLDGLRIVNRTDDRLVIYEVVPPYNTEDVEAEVPPHSAVVTGVKCASNLLRAKRDGILVAERGPFSRCHEEDWIIRE